MSKDAYYFPHDAGARNDQRIVLVRAKYGLRGYGIYFCIVEMLREADQYKLREDATAIAYELHEEIEIVSDILKNFELFNHNKKGLFWSESLLRRMEKKDSISRKRAEVGRLGGVESAKQKSSKAQANVKQNSSKIKLRKEKKGEERRRKENINTLPETTRQKTPQVEFVEQFAAEYERLSKSPYKADSKDFIVAARLINKYGIEAVKEKAQILAVYCSGKVDAWFARDGWADFTIGKLSSCWNHIIPKLTEEQKRKQKSEKEFERLREHDADIDAAISKTAI